ncbi:MAG: hypothetical protein VB954_06765 [Thalassolituus sp.]|uniref:hypothetical protein n=1 Tax=Thalassolituus sp. TaxID=2030822 RepID=UPI0039825024
MSFRRDYKPLFSIRVVDHNSNAAIEEVVVEPTSQCRKLMQDHQLLAKQRSYGMQVFYSLNPLVAEPLMGAINSRVRLDFKLSLPTDFYQRYLPDVSGDKRLHLCNLDNSGALKAGSAVGLSAGASIAANDALHLVGERFELAISPPVGAASFELRQPFDAAVLNTFDLAELGQGARLEFDLERLESGRYRLSPDNTPAQVTDLFVENEVAGQRCQALISIYVETPQTLAPVAGYQFNARFESR